MQLDMLNTLTKYPSIPTYHVLSQGKLTREHLTVPAEPLLLTEKVDGTNTRVILGGPRDFVVGSRQELLHASGDLVANPALGIVDTSLETCREAVRHAQDLYACLQAEPAHDLVVLYFEVYGGKVTSASRNYCGNTSTTSLRLFDVAVVFDAVGLTERHTMGDLAAMRESGQVQRWASEAQLGECARAVGAALTPRVGELAHLPVSLHDCQALLEEHARTRCALDGEARGGSEGLVARTASRSFVAKLRVEDYRRALR